MEPAVRALFLNQGRASPGVAMGIQHVERVLRATWPVDAMVDADFTSIPPLGRFGRLGTLSRRLTFPHDFLTLRWHLARSAVGRRYVVRALESPSPPSVLHVTTVQCGLLLGALAERVPVVYCQDVSTTDWCKLLRGLAPAEPTPLDLKPVEALERRALRSAAVNTAWTQATAERMRALAPDVETVVLHPGIELARFYPRQERRPGPIRVLFVGGRWAQKGGPELVSALAPAMATGAVELHVVTTHDLDPTPGLVRHTADADVAAVLRDADIFALPTRVDGAPIAIAEALASGLPVVATPIASIPSMVSRCGSIVPVGDAQALRSAVLELAGDAELRQRLGAEGRRQAEQLYDARANTRRLVTLLERVQGARQRGKRRRPIREEGP
jgi:glycosyltransferase involved in cell wall biosynthesis